MTEEPAKERGYGRYLPAFDLVSRFIAKLSNFVVFFLIVSFLACTADRLRQNFTFLGAMCYFLALVVIVLTQYSSTLPLEKIKLMWNEGKKEKAVLLRAPMYLYSWSVGLVVIWAIFRFLEVTGNTSP